MPSWHLQIAVESTGNELLGNESCFSYNFPLASWNSMKLSVFEHCCFFPSPCLLPVFLQVVWCPPSVLPSPFWSAWQRWIALSSESLLPCCLTVWPPWWGSLGIPVSLCRKAEKTRRVRQKKNKLPGGQVNGLYQVRVHTHKLILLWRHQCFPHIPFAWVGHPGLLTTVSVYLVIHLINYL